MIEGAMRKLRGGKVRAGYIIRLLVVMLSREVRCNRRPAQMRRLLGQQPMVSPSEVRVEHTDRIVLAAELWGGTGPVGVRFVTRCVMNLSVQEVRICQVEEAHVTEIRRREPPAELRPEPLGQVDN